MLKRCGKEARALAELNKAPAAVVEFGRQVMEQLVAIVARGVPLPPVPILPAAA